MQSRKVTQARRWGLCVKKIKKVVDFDKSCVILNLTKQKATAKEIEIKDGRLSVHIRVRQVTVPKEGFL